LREDRKVYFLWGKAFYELFFFGLPSGCTTDDEKLVTSFID